MKGIEKVLKNLFIVKRIINDKTLSDEAFVVWCGLRNIMVFESITEYFVSYNLIADLLFRRVPTRSEVTMIKKGLGELIEKEYIIVIYKYNSTDFRANLSKLYFNHDEYFANLTDDEMRKIMNIPTSKTSTNCKLLRYFSCMIGTFNFGNTIEIEYRGKIGGMSLDTFPEMLDITKPTISEYNNILEVNKLLFVIRHKDFLQGTNAKGQSVLREIPNTYSRYCDKELAIKFAEEKHGYKYYKHMKDIKTQKSNEKRRLAQKYIRLCDGKKYDEKTINEIKSYCIEFNRNAEIQHNEMIAKGYKHILRLKDMSVFD